MYRFIVVTTEVGEVLLEAETIIKIVGFLVGSGVLAGMVKLVYSCGKVISDINYLKTTIDRDVKADLRAIRKDVNEATPEIADIKSKVEILWRDRTSSSHSPRRLNQRGQEILGETGIRRVIESRLGDIVRKVRALKPKNAYEAEQAVVNEVAKLKNDPTVKKAIEPMAFRAGSTPDEVLFVGAVYIRDSVFDALKLDTAKT